VPVIAKKCGYIEKLNAEEVGKIAMNLGAGRIRKEDNIEYSVGIELLKKVGDSVVQGETLAYIHANDEEKGTKAVEELFELYKISEKRANKIPDILKIII